MKKNTILILLIVTVTFFGCTPFSGGSTDDEPLPTSNYEPILLHRVAFENSLTIEPAKSIENAGKIYVKDDYLFINEINKGFHVFDNSNPSNPQKIAFLKVAGSKDLAIKDEVFYIHNATDLISLKPNFNDLTFQLTKRIKNTFPQMLSPDGFYSSDLGEDEIIINWILID